ncbi:hypothetical protein [Sediminibacter sp. Hel_I_10]|uniref:hypothetical protein n=1 Tax=Sediminibacter sp. Hel_I_10 TaxID=1392490 RepID=UPI0004794F5F|nr:hypothetical protein [Sediminibacter sp. Hel_I_10]
MIEVWRVLIDFGLVVLIWIVQLIIYPSFKFYETQDLIKWHKIYTRRLGMVVMPLMIAQLAIYGYLIFQVQTWFNLFGSVTVLLLWLSTFFQFVPLHNKISDHNYSKETLNALVKLNWIRTGLWTLIFVASFYQYIN